MNRFATLRCGPLCLAAWGAPVLVTDDFPPGSSSDLHVPPLCGRIVFGTKMAANRAQVRLSY